MKKRSLAILLSVMMALGIMANAPAALAATWEEDTALTLVLPEQYAEDLATPAPGTDPADPENPEEAAEPADPVGVVVDLYLVAEAKPWAGYDAYTYEEPAEGFESLTMPDMNTVTVADWDKLAWEASDLVLKAATGDAPVKAVLKDVELDTKITREPGLYLLIPHGKGMKPEQYITSLDVEGAEGAEPHMATLANSADYTYTFRPQLVSLPEQGVGDPAEGEDGETVPGVFNGTWDHEVEVTLKPEQQARFGKLTITKEIDYYEENEPATFVFEVTATKDIDGDGEEEEVYRNTVALTFSPGVTPEPVELDRVPVGSHVTVREIYSGAFYTAAAAEQDGNLTVEGLLNLTFSNTHGPDQKRGHGIINQFTFNGTSWGLNAVNPNAAEPAPEPEA